LEQARGSATVGVLQDQVAEWNARALAYRGLTRRWRVFEDMADRLVASLPADLGSGVVVDVGGGTGLCGERVLARFPDAAVHLVEPAGRMRAQTPSIARFAGLWSIRAEKLGELQGELSADAIISSAVMHMVDEREAMPGMAALLKPGGILAFNLWWHADEETAGFDPDDKWLPLLERSISEFGRRIPQWPDPRRGGFPPRSGPSLQVLAFASGLMPVERVIEYNAIRASFFIDFRAMWPDWPPGLGGTDRSKVLTRAKELARAVISVPTVRYVFRKE